MKFDGKFVNFNLYFIYIKLGVFQKTKLKRNVLRWIRGTLKAQLIGILWWYLKFCVLFFKIKKKNCSFICQISHLGPIGLKRTEKIDSFSGTKEA